MRIKLSPHSQHGYGYLEAFRPNDHIGSIGIFRLRLVDFHFANVGKHTSPMDPIGTKSIHPFIMMDISYVDHIPAPFIEKDNHLLQEFAGPPKISGVKTKKLSQKLRLLFWIVRTPEIPRPVFLEFESKHGVVYEPCHKGPAKILNAYRPSLKCNGGCQVLDQ